MSEKTPQYNYAPILVSTIPRSGTFWCHYFFQFYYQNWTDKTISKEGVTDYPKDYSVGLGGWPFIVAHAYCPGYLECLGDLRDAWEALPQEPGFNYGEEIMRHSGADFSPLTSPDAKICLLYRNPMDQALSLYLQLSHAKKEEQNLAQRLGDPRKFFYEYHCVEKYIKQYVTFKSVHRLHPANVLLIRYEDLVQAPETIFLKIVCHFCFALAKPDGRLSFLPDRLVSWMQRSWRRQWLWAYARLTEISKPRKRKYVRHAVDLTQPNHMKIVERELGHPLTGEHMDRRHSHLNDGQPGDWRKVFRDEDFQFMKRKFMEFGVPLSDFVFDKR